MVTDNHKPHVGLAQSNSSVGGGVVGSLPQYGHNTVLCSFLPRLFPSRAWQEVSI